MAGGQAASRRPRGLSDGDMAPLRRRDAIKRAVRGGAVVYGSPLLLRGTNGPRHGHQSRLVLRRCNGQKSPLALVTARKGDTAVASTYTALYRR
ncbi:hypothetical protein MRX96_045069 [Rhipicephalus microplus]